MFTRTRKIVVVVGMAGSMLLGSARTAGAVATPARPSEHRPGATLAQLTAQWWQWSIAIPLADHPFNDPPAHDCAYGQSGRTWFLGGVFNATGIATRNCTVPRGTSLLVPAINVECSNVEAAPYFGKTEAKQRACARAFELTEPYIKLDGRRVALTYVVSPQFRFAAPADNVLGVSGPVRGTSVSVGWWALVQPPKGVHRLEFGGTFPAFGLTIDMTYSLTVV